mgnify:CR=1 FL=1
MRSVINWYKATLQNLESDPAIARIKSLQEDYEKAVEDLAKRIDHTNLRPYASIDSIMETILEAKRYGFRGVCIPPVYVKKARDMLRGSEVKVITVIGFPLGYVPTKVKVLEAKIAEESGADEIDVVMSCAYPCNSCR